MDLDPAPDFASPGLARPLLAEEFSANFLHSTQALSFKDVAQLADLLLCEAPDQDGRFLSGASVSAGLYHRHKSPRNPTDLVSIHSLLNQVKEAERGHEVGTEQLRRVFLAKFCNKFGHISRLKTVLCCSPKWRGWNRGAAGLSQAQALLDKPSQCCSLRREDRRGGI